MRILVTSGYSYWGAFLPTEVRNPESKMQLGGGETAMINIARELATLGNQVVVLHDIARFGTYEGVDYLPSRLFADLVTQWEHDVLVSWDSPQAFRLCDRSKLHVMAYQLNDTQVGVLDHAIDLYFHPSQWHADRYASLYPEISRVKQRYPITNGIDPIRYAQEVQRRPYSVIHSSSPDRGLHHLLRMWTRIKELEPKATLDVYYDTKKWLDLVQDLIHRGYYVNTGDRAQRLMDFMKAFSTWDSGVTFHGGVGQWKLAHAQLASSVMVYPCDPVQPTEGFSMSCLEGITAGCYLVTSTADALSELWSSAPNTCLLPPPTDNCALDDVWIETIVSKLRLGTQSEGQVPRLNGDYVWRAIAVRWIE